MATGPVGGHEPTLARESPRANPRDIAHPAQPSTVEAGMMDVMQRHQVERRGPHPVVRRALTVAQVERPTPSVVRLTLTGPELAGFSSEAPDDHIKIFLPDPDPRASRPAMRDYTPRRYGDGELEVDIVLHGILPR